MDAVIKASLYLGAILLLGAGSYRFFISATHHLRHWAVVGAILLSSGSVLHLTQTVSKVLGRFDPDFIWQYALSTQHGRLTFIRLALMLVILVVVWFWHSRTTSVVFSLTALGLLATFSQLSHAASMRGTPAMLADLTHYSAATLWSSAILFSVLTKVWEQAAFARILKRISRLSLICVLLLTGTGVYASRIHIQDSQTLISSMYGRVLLVKLGIFLLVLGLAALNRWYFMPHLQRHGKPLTYTLVIEAALLVIILAVTGLLTVSPVPHEM